jgi:broad specificity phosphatase PhoE
VLVRHGETVGNSSIRYYGRTDLELSARGRAQMRAAARVLSSSLGISKFLPIFSSPLVRAKDGARIIGGAARIVEIDEFREVDFGDFEGLTASEIESRYPDEFLRWNRDRLAPNYVYPHGESRAAFAQRVERGLTRILSMIPPSGPSDSATLLVAHRGVIRTIVQGLTGSVPVIELGSIQLLTHAGGSGWTTDQLDLIPQPIRTSSR